MADRLLIRGGAHVRDALRRCAVRDRAGAVGALSFFSTLSRSTSGSPPGSSNGCTGTTYDGLEDREPRQRTASLARSFPVDSEQPIRSIACADGGGGRGGNRYDWTRKGGHVSSKALIAGAIPVSYVAYSTSAEAKEIPKVKIPSEVVLYQYEACPFCNKVKAFLDYHSIPYRVVEVNPIGKKEIKWSEYKKVPILVVDGEQLNDSSAIITTLDKQLQPKKGEDDEETRWRKWVDDHLVHTLSPNIYRTPGEAVEAFEYITTNGNFSAWERLVSKYAGATAMYFVSMRLKKKYNITDERKSLYDAANMWMDAVGPRNFLGGSKPNLADLAVFGVLRPIRHLRAGEELVQNTKIAPWYQRMEAEVGDSMRMSELQT